MILRSRPGIPDVGRTLPAAALRSAGPLPPLDLDRGADVSLLSNPLRPPGDHPPSD